MKAMDTLETMAGFLEKTPFFEGAPHKAMEDLVEASDIIAVAAGETIIREGEYELICYVTLSGRFKIEVTDKETGKKRLVKLVGEGELLGEMSILSGNPRFAAVSCVEDAQVLRITRDGLLAFMDAAPSVKSRIDADYRKRVLNSSLRKINVFSLVDDMSLEALAKKVEMVTFQKGDVIFASGDSADAFYLIRDGFVKITRNLDESESAFFDARFDKAYSKPMREGTGRSFIMAYLGKGSYCGERALFDKRQRVASAEAVTRVDVVRIRKEDFDDLMRRHPLVAEKLKEEGSSRYANEAQVRNQVSQDMLSWIGNHDILVTDSILIMDLYKCVRCLRCVSVCAELHDGGSRITHNGVRFNNILIPTSCRHCREPTCMIGCPTGAIQRDIHGEVFHTSACIGCGNCARRCPFGNISMVQVSSGAKGASLEGVVKWLTGVFTADGRNGAEAGKKGRRAVKCDMCKDYKRMGCQHNCPTGAIMSVKPVEYFAKLARKMSRND
jgi:CRP-like cAMP-binding protein/Fe-S-cluster-containing hydrogenase component 2